jgi:hypothetical protein
VSTGGAHWVPSGAVELDAGECPRGDLRVNAVGDVRGSPPCAQIGVATDGDETRENVRTCLESLFRKWSVVRGDLFAFRPPKLFRMNGIKELAVARERQKKRMLDAGRPMDRFQGSGLTVQLQGMNRRGVTVGEGRDEDQRLLGIRPLRRGAHHRTRHNE